MCYAICIDGGGVDMKCSLFEQNLSAMNYFQLAEWLIACRTFIRRENYDSNERYLSMVEMFCAEWEAHYQQHKRLYETEKFKKALCYIQFKHQLKCYVDFSNGKEAIDTAYNLLQQSIFYEPVLKEIDNSFTAYYTDIQAVFLDKTRYKEKLHNVIVSQAFNGANIRVRAFTDGGRWIKASGFQEFMDNCEKQSYRFETDQRRTTKNSYIAAFQEYDISRSVYGDYIHSTTEEQEFGKKFFINLAFLLGLNATNTETLLKWNGYAMKESVRMFDAICQKAFYIGFGRDYTIALIDKYNAELAAKGRAYKPMPNITKTKRC